MICNRSLVDNIFAFLNRCNQDWGLAILWPVGFASVVEKRLLTLSLNHLRGKSVSSQKLGINAFRVGDGVMISNVNILIRSRCVNVDMFVLILVYVPDNAFHRGNRFPNPWKSIPKSTNSDIIHCVWRLITSENSPWRLKNAISSGRSILLTLLRLPIVPIEKYSILSTLLLSLILPPPNTIRTIISNYRILSKSITKIYDSEMMILYNNLVFS